MLSTYYNGVYYFIGLFDYTIANIGYYRYNFYYLTTLKK